MHTYNFKERVQNEADLHYVHGMFDMIYTLDYLENHFYAEAVMLPGWVKFRKIEELLYITDKYVGDPRW